MKHLKTFEALNFNFEEGDTEVEEIQFADENRIFTDFEQDYLETIGFTYSEFNKRFSYNDENVWVEIYKYPDGPERIFISCRVWGPGPAPIGYGISGFPNQGYQNPIDNFRILLEDDRRSEDDRIELLEKMMRRIYVAINVGKKAEERKRRKQNIKPPSVDPYMEENWWETKQ